MKKTKQFVIACFLFLSVMFGGGCIDAVTSGFADGVNSAISGVIETLVTQAFEWRPIP